MSDPVEHYPWHLLRWQVSRKPNEHAYHTGEDIECVDLDVTLVLEYRALDAMMGFLRSPPTTEELAVILRYITARRTGAAEEEAIKSALVVQEQKRRSP